MDYPTRIFDYLENLKTKYPKDDIFARCVNGVWHKVSVDDYIKNSRSIAYGLLEKGYQPDDKIVVVTGNRPEWNFLDMGSVLAGMVFVPVYPTLSQEEFMYIFKHSDSSAIFAGNETLYYLFKTIVSKMDHKPDLFLIDSSTNKPCLKDLMREGEKESKKWSKVINNNIKDINPNIVASIVYTSGTTGTPKGVMLTHRNLTFNAHAHAIRQTYTEKHRMLSFLPLSHVYERTMNYEYQEKGISTYYAESLKTLARDMENCRADGFCAVPRVLETIFGNFEKAGKQQKGLKRLIYRWCWYFGINFDNYNTNPIYKFRHKLADKLIYSKWRKVLGGHELLIVSGGSSIRPQIVKLFNAAKMRIFEGYGMTEASPVIAVNSPMDGYNIIGTVGKPIDGTELIFSKEGEILTRGPHVMKGYYKDPEATKMVIDKEGWLHTGDIGCLHLGEYIKITDRKKEIFKLSNGKYIAPQMIEAKVTNSPYFDNCMVIGENRKFTSAVISVKRDMLKSLCEELKIEYTGNQNLFRQENIRKRLKEEIRKINLTIATYEAIKRPLFVFDEWTTANGLLSQTLKLKRKALYEKYVTQIEKRVYNED